MVCLFYCLLVVHVCRQCQPRPAHCRASIVVIDAARSSIDGASEFVFDWSGLSGKIKLQVHMTMCIHTAFITCLCCCTAVCLFVVSLLVAKITGEYCCTSVLLLKCCVLYCIVHYCTLQVASESAFMVVTLMGNIKPLVYIIVNIHTASMLMPAASYRCVVCRISQQNTKHVHINPLRIRKGHTLCSYYRLPSLIRALPIKFW